MTFASSLVGLVAPEAGKGFFLVSLSLAMDYTGSIAETIVNDAGGTITNFLSGVGWKVAVVAGAPFVIFLGYYLARVLMRAFWGAFGPGRDGIWPKG